MQKKLSLRLLPSQMVSDSEIRKLIAKEAGIHVEDLTGYTILKKSIDARQQHVYYTLTVQAYIQEEVGQINIPQIQLKDVSASSKTVIIVGAGPAGLFAALKLLSAGIKPIIIERGKDVRSRRRDLALLNKQGIINPESNYCFGEGGAGTYSDGKLYTRSKKRGSIEEVLGIFIQYGADGKIFYETHPHIGTNKLPHIITAMRNAIIDHGGEILFQKKLTSFKIVDGAISAAICSDGDEIAGQHFILATGHSARDVFYMLHEHGIRIEAKPFALGVRVEHPQSLIDSIQYHCMLRDENLPPASYSLVQQVQNNGVFSFCMCPGGIIAPASTNHNEVVVNGWSPSKRNNPYANSGIVVSVEDENLKDNSSVFRFLDFQTQVETAAYKAGGGQFKAPAQRLEDFVQGRVSKSLPDCSYNPGVTSNDMKAVLPKFIHNSLKEGFKVFGKRMKGYLTNDAIIVATESRTSSPIKIPRYGETLRHPQISNLYPCGEGAGYAGGIVSAAMDGLKIADRIIIES